jgi:cytoskeletal protein RodZ
MKSIGEYLKEARLKKRYSLAKVEDETKIKKEFIEAIEKMDWKKLPDFSIVLGFVKSMAQFLDIDDKKTAAIFRRDYSFKKEVGINPKPDISRQFTWTPKLTFWLGMGLTVLAILGYLGFQYKRFVSPPSLSVSEPKEGQTITLSKVLVVGKTDEDATVKVNNQPVLLGTDGTFEVEIQIYGGTKEIVVQAISRSGKKTIIRRTINPMLQ